MRPPKRLKAAQQHPTTGTTSWTLSCPPNYSLRAAVASYGFFMLAPNRLTPVSSQCLAISLAKAGLAIDQVSCCAGTEL